MWDDAEWHRSGWVFLALDSGASMSVVSRDVLKQFQHSEIQNNVGPLQAANGTSVDLEGSCKLLLQIEVLDRDGNVKPAVIPLDVMVGRTTYPIISVCKLTQQGWDVTFDQDHVRMFHRKSQHVVRDLLFLHDTPWIRVVLYEGNDVALNVSPVVADSFPKGDTVCALSADQMVQHRFRGHRPYEPTCEVCQSCRGVTKHSRKKTPKGTEFEIHADFGFLNKDFEWVPESEDSEKGNVKFLVLRESYSSSIGCVLMTGDRQRDNRQLQKWLFEMGLWGSKDQHSLRVITDAESSVGNFIASAGLPMGVVVERAPPQGHQANGTAERTIREIKESLKTLQLDFQKMGYTLVFSSLVLQCCMNYICFAHNNFTTVQQSSRTPRDLVIGDKARNHAFALFGCKVLAEIPESVKSKNPNLPRFVEGVYLHPEFSSMGVWVSARIRIGSEMVTQRFVAKSIKLCMPVEILDGHGLFVELVDERSGLPEAPRSSEEVVVPLPSDLKCPATGPPVKWLDEHGVSLKCSACKEIEIRGTRGNKNHSRACMERYENWIRSELNLARGSKLLIVNLRVSRRWKGKVPVGRFLTLMVRKKFLWLVKVPWIPSRNSILLRLIHRMMCWLDQPLNLRLNQRLNPRSRWMWTLGVGKGARPRLGVLLSLVVFLDLIPLVATLRHLLESSENGQKRISWLREEVWSGNLMWNLRNWIGRSGMTTNVLM